MESLILIVRVNLTVFIIYEPGCVVTQVIAALITLLILDRLPNMEVNFQKELDILIVSISSRQGLADLEQHVNTIIHETNTLQDRPH